MVKVRELSKVGELISGAVIAGDNSTSGPNFSIDDLDKIQSQARDIAIQKAQEKAKDIADSAGVKLGKIVSINEGFQVPFAFSKFAETFEAGAPAPPVIEPGSQEVKANVVITYEIK